VTNTGNVTLAAVGSTPNGNAATLVGQTLNLQPANGGNPGVISLFAQTMGAGIKTFLNDINGNENMVLLETASSAIGNYLIGATRFHNYSPFGAGLKNVFIGENAGNYFNTGTIN